ncbi:MAG: biopolymer transporter ExbD [Verrucomicrobiota bacterium]
MASGGGGDGEPDFQIAPMIDVLLVLLVFFVMITSAEVLKVDKELTLPVSPSAKKREAEMAKHEFAVNVRHDPDSNKGVLVLDDKVYAETEWPQATERIANQKKIDDKLRVVIRADKNVPAGEIQRIMGMVAEAGVSNIAFSASNK